MSTTTNKKADKQDAAATVIVSDELNVTRHINNSDESLVLDALTSQSITNSVSLDEKLNASREALRSLTSEEVKGLDEQRKANREQLSVIFRTKLTIDMVTSVCNELLMPLNGGDANARKRAQRRREFFKRCVVDSYPAYDMEVSKGKKGGIVSFKYVGDDSQRKAVKLMEVYHELRKYMADLPDLNTKNVASLLRAGEPTTAGILDKVPAALVVGTVVDNTMDTLQGIADKISAMDEEKKQANG